MSRLFALFVGLLTLMGSALMVSNASAQDPATAPDEAWISVSGTVVDTGPDAIRLDYGDGVITVEVDDFDAFAEGTQLMENDQVKVFGRIDDDLFERRTIEASSVYVQNLGTFFYASSIDEEDYLNWTIAQPVTVGEVEILGTVTAVDGREFTVANSLFSVTVDTKSLAYNPMDDRGYQRIEVGDRVRVFGDMRDTLIDSTELSAEYIVELSR